MPVRCERSENTVRNVRAGERWLSRYRGHPSPAREVLEFLPAVLEIQESPPSPIGKLLLWLILGFCGAGLIWATVGQVDIVAVAQGRIITSDRAKVVQPFHMGIVRAIHVRDGQRVREGEILIELDPTESEADETRIAKDLAHARLEQQRLSQILTLVNDGVEEDEVIEEQTGQSPEAITQNRLLRSQLREYRANLAALDSELAQQKQALEISREEEKKLSAILPLVRERAATLKDLTEKRFYDRHTWLKIEQERIVFQRDAAAERHRVMEIQAEIRRVAHRRIALKGEFQTRVLEQLAETQKQIQRLTQELLKAQQLSIWRQLKAPVTGVIQELAVHTVGGVVTPAQSLMVIVPEDHPLDIEAWILNKDIGFVEAEQSAQIKLDTFPFTRYGTLAGIVSHISRDAVEHESLGFGYPARISMTSRKMRIDGKLINLSPGMDVTVEIKTGKRRLIEYVLSPLLRYQTESMRER